LLNPIDNFDIIAYSERCEAYRILCPFFSVESDTVVSIFKDILIKLLLGMLLIRQVLFFVFIHINNHKNNSQQSSD
jgi:hypothetical protein